VADTDTDKNGGVDGLKRLDRWLWAVRVFKTRPLASEACRSGRVKVNDLPAKPARELRPGEIVAVRLDDFTRTFRVAAAPRSRVGAKAVGDFCVEVTSAAELEKRAQRRQSPNLIRDLGSGRPTKRDRRRLDQLLGYSG
jgi:ribosome-associated heat shock protein Hsp15